MRQLYERQFANFESAIVTPINLQYRVMGLSGVALGACRDSDQAKGRTVTNHLCTPFVDTDEGKRQVADREYESIALAVGKLKGAVQGSEESKTAGGIHPVGCAQPGRARDRRPRAVWNERESVRLGGGPRRRVLAPRRQVQ